MCYLSASAPTTFETIFFCFWTPLKRKGTPARSWTPLWGSVGLKIKEIWKNCTSKISLCKDYDSESRIFIRRLYVFFTNDIIRISILNYLVGPDTNFRLMSSSSWCLASEACLDNKNLVMFSILTERCFKRKLLWRCSSTRFVYFLVHFSTQIHFQNC